MDSEGVLFHAIAHDCVLCLRPLIASSACVLWSLPIRSPRIPSDSSTPLVPCTLEDVDAASKVVQRRDGKTGVVARLEQKLPSLSPEERTLLVGAENAATPWRLLLGSDDSDVKELCDELMSKSKRLKAAAIAPESVRAAAAGLRVPRPPPPSNERELRELEKKSPAERAMDAAAQVRSHPALP